MLDFTHNPGILRMNWTGSKLVFFITGFSLVFITGSKLGFYNGVKTWFLLQGQNLVFITGSKLGFYNRVQTWYGSR